MSDVEAQKAEQVSATKAAKGTIHAFDPASTLSDLGEQPRCS